MTKNFKKICIKKIYDNINFSKNKGMIIASPSNDPPYKFHWIRDASLVMRVIIDYYKKYKNDNELIHIFNYIENESQIQNLNTISGLGEPKINIDKTAFNDSWGRPQNDGPPLRGINMIKIFKLLNNDYNVICNKIVKEIIEKDLQYTINNYNKPCFELWEEIQGWHFYTRLVQLKFLKDFINLKIVFKNIDLEKVKKVFNDLKINIMHHVKQDYIISSFDKNGNINKLDDASILLAFCHIDFDDELISLIPVELCIKNANNLIGYFRNKYNINDLNLIGRYQNDKYYNGEIWIICSLALSQIYKYLSSKNEKFIKYKKISDKIISYIKSIDVNYDLAEQYNPIKKKKLSAKKLTWNYAELYFSIN